MVKVGAPTETPREDGPRDIPLLEVRDVAASYGPTSRRVAWRRHPARCVIEGVDLTLERGECVGLVGQTGSGKTTLGNCVSGLQRVVKGEVRYGGRVVSSARRAPAPPRVRGIQAVYQDPYSALNPLRTVGSILREILLVHGLVERKRVDERCTELVRQVGLEGSVLSLRPRALSGGICQRIAITRALALQPSLLIADEITSALDASVQAQVINLLADLREQTQIAILFITHDLAIVNQLCERLIVLHKGRVVEAGQTSEVLSRPKHSHTQDLIASVPHLGGSS